MKTAIALLLALSAGLTLPAAAATADEPLVARKPAGTTDAVRELAGRQKVGRLPARVLPAGTTDALRYAVIRRTADARTIQSHRKPLGTTDRIRQLAGARARTIEAGYRG